MNMMKKLAAVSVLLAAFSGGVAAQAGKLPPLPAFDSTDVPADGGAVKPVGIKSPKPLRIAVLGLENNPFWIPVKEGTMKAAEELKPFNVTVEWINAGAQHTTDVFSKAIEAAMAMQYDAIVTIAGDSGIVPFINRAVDAGIPVATFNSETETENKRAFFVGADLYRQGETAGKTMAELLNGKGKVAIITGFFSVESHELRRKGFEDYVAKNAPGITIVDRVEDQDKADIAYKEANDFMTANGDLAAIFVTAGGNFGAAKAVEEAGKAGKIKIVGYDFVDETMEFVKKGVISGTIGQDPFAQGHDPAVRLYNYMVGGVAPEAGRLLTKSDFVTKDNIDKYYSK
ncbi:MAG: substrate-binding domain-containing protein [Propionivibrio sp.]